MTANSPLTTSGSEYDADSSNGKTVDLEPARDLLNSLGSRIGAAYRQNPRLVIGAGIGALAVFSVLVRLASGRK